MRIGLLIPGMLGMALVITGAVVREPRICVCPPRDAALICGWRKSLAQRPRGKKGHREGRGLRVLSGNFGLQALVHWLALKTRETSTGG